MLYWLIAISLLLAVYACCFTFSRDVRFFSKLILYGVCVVVGSTIGGIKCIFNGRTTDNHYIIFDSFVKTCSWMQINIQVENQELLESDEPYVMIANHQAALDVYTMVHVWPKNCVVMLKSSLKYVPGFNLCAWLCCAIFIDRTDKTRAHQSVGKCEKAILENKRKIFIYPEGTRNAGTDMLPFKKGAFVIAKNTNVPIVPCVFSSYRPFYSYAERRFDSGTITVRVLPKIYPKDKTVDELANECREVMLKTLKNGDTKKSN
ncbi:1-acyl-sn-glycerol-3-phosphate acyltransferase [Aphelenchoides besseyi]|nr:1-acyl-sn-glycerol-3-phosphate acyltransferase [Aphelenchoides besseyi]KAI6209490.1 1-acyl-sn-glycerol-3-phosphate acyltransferase [Aphelenchoides besseyi]